MRKRRCFRTPTEALCVYSKEGLKLLRVYSRYTSTQDILELSLDILEFSMDIPEISLDILEFSLDILEFSLHILEFSLDILDYHPSSYTRQLSSP